MHGSARTEVRLAMRRGNLGHPASARCLWGERGFGAIELLFPFFEHVAGLEPMRWNSVKKTAPCAVLCQLAYNHAIMDLRAYKETLNSLKTPMQGVFVVVLCTVAFVVWLGVLVVITKLLMG